MKPVFRHLPLCALMFCASDALSAPAKTVTKITPTEAKAAAILREVENASKKYRTMTADFEVRQLGNLSAKGQLRVMKPNLVFASYRDTYGSDKRQRFSVNDGKFRWKYPLSSDGNEYIRFPIAKNETFIGLSTADTIVEMFLDLRRVLKNDFMQQPFRFMGVQRIDSQTFRVLERIEFQSPWKGQTYFVSTKLFVGDNNIIQREIHHIHSAVPKKDPKSGSLDEFKITNIKLNVPMTAAQFQWKPPAGATQAKPIQ